MSPPAAWSFCPLCLPGSHSPNKASRARYLLNINNLGKYCVNLSPSCANSDPQIVQEIMNASSGIWGSPAYWNGNLYWTGANDPIRAYSFQTRTAAA